jgi:hypothetical protein
MLQSNGLMGVERIHALLKMLAGASGGGLDLNMVRNRHSSPRLCIYYPPLLSKS